MTTRNILIVVLILILTVVIYYNKKEIELIDEKSQVVEICMDRIKYYQGVIDNSIAYFGKEMLLDEKSCVSLNIKKKQKCKYRIILVVGLATDINYTLSIYKEIFGLTRFSKLIEFNIILNGNKVSVSELARLYYKNIEVFHALPYIEGVKIEPRINDYEVFIVNYSNNCIYYGILQMHNTRELQRLTKLIKNVNDSK